MPKFKVEEYQRVRQVWTYEIEAETETEALNKVIDRSDEIESIYDNAQYTIENDYDDEYHFNISEITE